MLKLAPVCAAASCPDAEREAAPPPAYWAAFEHPPAPSAAPLQQHQQAIADVKSAASYETTKDGVVSCDALLRDHNQLMLFLVTHNSAPTAQVRISGFRKSQASKKHPNYDFHFGLDVSKLVGERGSIQADPQGCNGQSVEAILKAYGNSGARVASVIMQKRLMWQQDRLQQLIEEHLRRDIGYRHCINVELKYGNPDGDGHEYVEARTCRGWASWSVASSLSSAMARKHPPALQSCFPMAVSEDRFVEICKLIISRGARTKLKAVKPISDLPKELIS